MTDAIRDNGQKTHGLYQARRLLNECGRLAIDGRSELGRSLARWTDAIVADLGGEGLLPMINSQRVQLLDLPKLKTQLVALERRTGRAGKDSIDHPPGARDDIANAVAGCLVGLADRVANLDGMSMAANDEFAQTSDFGSESWSYTQPEEGVKGATDGEIMSDWSRRQND